MTWFSTKCRLGLERISIPTFKNSFSNSSILSEPWWSSDSASILMSWFLDKFKFLPSKFHFHLISDFFDPTYKFKIKSLVLPEFLAPLEFRAFRYTLSHLCEEPLIQVRDNSWKWENQKSSELRGFRSQFTKRIVSHTHCTAHFSWY